MNVKPKKIEWIKRKDYRIGTSYAGRIGNYVAFRIFGRKRNWNIRTHMHDFPPKSYLPISIAPSLRIVKRDVGTLSEAKRYCQEVAMQEIFDLLFEIKENKGEKK